MLNAKQQEAAMHKEGPLLIIAGAGSGKTRVVTHRILHLLEQGVPAAEILAVTFTNKAAEEMQKRIHALAHCFVLTTTFHALGAQILRESIPPFVIFDEEDSEKTLKECFAQKGIKEDKSVIKTVRAAISAAKNSFTEPKEDPVLLDLYTLYQAKLKSYNAVDFDDLLFLPVQLLQESPNRLAHYQQRWSYILIDEYQDTNHAQYLLIKLLAECHHNVFAVGDPDQSIYSWRGANIHNILNFEKDFPGAKRITLEENYRSKNNILQGANGLIKHNESRQKKNLFSAQGDGAKIGLYIAEDDYEEIAFVIQKLKSSALPLKESVIFYRTHFQSRLIEDSLIRARIPYIIIGGLSFYMRREIKDLLSYLRMVLDKPDFLSFARTINLPKRGFGAKALQKIQQAHEAQGGDLLDLCEQISLSAKQQTGLNNYLALLDHLKKQPTVSEMLSELIDRSGYLDYLKEDPDTYQERRENVFELLSKASELGDTPLATFLQNIALQTGKESQDPHQDAVRLMTLHHGKGLEFTQVFLVGMEEELFPHANSRGKPEALEEERRLCYVGMTRAKEQLYLSAAGQRLLWGAVRAMEPSRFLNEIPKEYVQPLCSL